ncbi:hypothetical protein PO878_03950 [Iamia majanohamensis]|uniref:Uncharacterized protein n=1 Tax=Iamia majanohamensis TaxID=467976 RepID=A0AAE9Y8T9_9ACTN|nr:hypothetical protein [Iamia majanohamensis]WCO67876.1 hypothetical protein PO878_03950 [Iamia majanohamensis]
MPDRTYIGPAASGTVRTNADRLIRFTRGEPVTFTAEEADGLGDEWTTGGIPDGTIADIKKWVGTDPDRAAAALADEQTRPNPRVSLIGHLTDLATPGDPDAQEG